MSLSLARLGGCAIALVLAQAAVASDPELRVIHASPDAPAVDIRVNGAVAIPNLAFGEFAGYVSLPAATYDVEVVPAGLSRPVVIDASLTLEMDKAYSVYAVDTLASIEPLVVLDDRSPVESGSRVRFVHASPNAPAVDIAVAGGPVLFGNVEFKEVADALTVPAGTYNLEVRLAGTNTVVLPLGEITLGEGFAYTAVATGLVGGSPALGALLLTDVAPPAEVRVIHASPDAPNVDIRVNGAVAIPDLAFTEATDYVSLPEGDYDVEVVPAGLQAPVVIDATLALDAGVDYTVLAINTLASIEPLVLVDDRTLPGSGSRVRFVHGSPDAPAVDIAIADNGPVIIPNTSFGEAAEPITVPAGIYDLEVRVAGTDTVVLPLPEIPLQVNTVYTVVATGFAFGTPSLAAQIYIDAQGMSPAGPGDIDRDGKVGPRDLGILLGDWGTTLSRSDLNEDGEVNGNDLGVLFGSWTF
ncbi:MAG: DUF4397 domain-containing protein [Phycisphaerae bacterium]|nr:DUF4397 domain-containing protein [Phycisphaerae bacterium]